MEELILKFLGAGGDLATIGIFYVLMKHHTRLTVIETQLKIERRGLSSRET